VIVHGFAEARQPARVVLLGSRGFVGAAISRRLSSESVNHVGVGSKEVDLSDASAIAKLTEMLKATDAVVMLSALTPDKGRDTATLMKNLAMMQHLCRALEKTGCAHLVYFSSDAVYSFASGLVSEDTATSPQDLYGVMHLARETMARSLPKTAVLVLRPTGIYGAGDTHNAYGPNRFRRTAEKEGKIQLFGAGEETRDHIHVDDVAAITVRCLMHRSSGTLNLATGQSLSFDRVAQIIAKEFPKRVEIVSTPRANPITHRHYDVTNLIKAFPGIRLMTLDQVR
jgi:UDP-glucose 4-epimerase